MGRVRLANPNPSPEQEEASVSLPWREAVRKWEAEHTCDHEFMQVVVRVRVRVRVRARARGS